MANLDPLAMTVEQTADVLSKAAKRKITAEQIRKDIQDGAPTNGDKTIHLVNYTAWLASQAT